MTDLEADPSVKVLVSVLKFVESLESFVFQRRRPDSLGENRQCGHRKTGRDTIVIT
jgi:hypothetical protein